MIPENKGGKGHLAHKDPESQKSPRPFRGKKAVKPQPGAKPPLKKTSGGEHARKKSSSKLKGLSFSDLTSYYTFNLIALVILSFLAAMMVVLACLAFSGLSWDLPETAISLIPGRKTDAALALSVGTILAVLDALLHYWDRKMNIIASIIVTSVMVSGLAYQIIFPNPGEFFDVYVTFVFLLIVLSLDLFVVLTKRYPSLLEEHPRVDLPDIISQFEKLRETIAKMEQRLIAEEEKVKKRNEEIQALKTQISKQREELVSEEEKISSKLTEITGLKVELKKKENELAQEEEKLRLKRTELESMKTEISPERLMEEEERLRIRGEELFDAKIKLEREKREVAQEEEVISKQGIEIQIRRRMLDETMGDLTEEEEHLKARNEIYSKVKEKITELKGLEEEETLRGLQNRVESVVEGMNRADIDWMMRETETLKKKENKIGEIMTELEERYKEIRQKELEIERMKERWQIEEAEKLRKKEEELFSLKNEAEIKSRVAEELRKQLKAKETELHAIKTEYEKQMRKKIEDEEMLKVRELTEKEREKHKAKRMLYPFAAIVGQETMKKTLILNAVNPLIGGVLIRGQKGTAKSVSVRGLAEVLPEIECVAGCRYNCDPSDEENLCDECRTRKETGRFTIIKKPIPVIDLPLNVTEDRLIGSIDIEKILTEGKKAFEPGLFAECHRGILYVDEINLLDDYIVDLLLDAAAMGVVHVEREGVSISYLSRFIIVGSMNPEEGELRPQILDRIALQAEVTGIRDVAQRVEIVKRRDEFTKDPEGFRKKYAKDQEELRKKIISARELLPRVTTPEPLLKIISHLCIDFDAAGHRADIIIERTARTNAALNGRLETSLADIAEAAVLALPHRMRANPIVGEPFTPETVLKRLRKYEKEVK